jgi:hypothetical protein
MSEIGPDPTEAAWVAIREARAAIHAAVLKLSGIVVTEETPGRDELCSEDLERLCEEMDRLIAARRGMDAVLSNCE